MQTPETPRRRPGRWGRSLSRGTRLVLIGGLASGAAFATVTGISAATTTHSASETASSPSTTAPSGPLGTAPAPGARGGRHLIHPARGGAGTVTAIAGNDITLRTINGTETVVVSSSTRYTRERQTVSLSAVKVGDVLRVAGTRPTGSSTTEPGTGTLDATRVEIVEPSLAGRVSAVQGSTITLVGSDGQLLTVTTSGSTRYFNGPAQATASAVTAGSRVVAEGTRDSLTHLNADVVTVLPARPGGAHPAWRMGGPAAGPASFGAPGGGPGGSGGGPGGFGPAGGTSISD